MHTTPPRLGAGIGWRPQLAQWIAQRDDLGFVEIVAENFKAAALPRPLFQLRERGVAVIPHGISLSLGSAELPDSGRLDHLAQLAEQLGSPLISEHIAFVRAAGLEAGHLLPIPRTAATLEVLIENVLIAQAALPAPLALENITALLEWPDADMSEPEFLRRLVDRTGAWLLLDISNLFANAVNHGWDAAAYLEQYPWERIAYVHVGGGAFREGVYHDSHADAVHRDVLDLLTQLTSRADISAVMLERDDHFPSNAALTEEFDAILAARRAGDMQREPAHVI